MSLNLTLSPAQLELIARPGITITQAYNITNNSDSSVVLSTNVAPWKPKGFDGSVTYENTPSNPNFEFSLSNADLKLGQSFLLQPRQTRQLVLKIKSNSNASQTDSYFTFFVIQDLSNTFVSDTSQSGATGRIGSHILISTSDTENVVSKASISDFKALPKFKDILFPAIRFEALANNKSAYFYKTNGKLTVTKNNSVIKEFDLYPQNVLADSSRQIMCQNNNEPVICSLNPPFWPGKYTATINLDSSLGSPSATITFFIIPYILVSILFISLIFWILLIKLFHYRPQTQDTSTNKPIK